MFNIDRKSSIISKELPPIRSEFDRFLRRNRLEHLKYNHKGELAIVFYGEDGHQLKDTLSYADLVKKYGAPLEVTNVNIVMARTIQMSGLAEMAQSAVGYPHPVEWHYATKANPHAVFTTTATENGWGVEVSSLYDLSHIRHAMLTGQIRKDARIYCNGIAPLPNMYNTPDDLITIPGAVEVGNYHPEGLYDTTYLELINMMNGLGYKVVRIIDSAEEINYFLQGGREISKQEIGLREVAYTPIKNEEERKHAKSRHGMTWEDLQYVAAQLSKSKDLELTTYHAMISAASESPIDEMVESLLYFSDHFFALKKLYPSMKYFNMGGGIPSIGFSNFNHELFFKKLLVGLKKNAEKYNLEAPILVVESGSGISTEASSVLTAALNKKVSGVDENGQPYLFINGTTSIMTQLPDTFILGKDFPILPVNNVNHPTYEMQVGGPSCDSDDVNPRKAKKQARVRLPLGPNQVYIFPGTGAYQDSMFRGYASDGNDHCGYLQATRVFTWVENGKIHYKATTRGDIKNTTKQLGYK